MWRWWDPLEKSTWILPSGFSHVDNQVRQILCRQAGKKLCFLSFSLTCSDIQHMYNVVQVLLSDCTFSSQTWYKSQDLVIQRSLSKFIYLFAVPEVFAFALFWKFFHLLGGVRGLQILHFSGFSLLTENMKSHWYFQFCVAWFTGICVTVQFLPLASGREINYMLLEFYVFLHKSHLQFVLVFSKEPRKFFFICGDFLFSPESC